jgi:hypothetical protein
MALRTVLGRCLATDWSDCFVLDPVASLSVYCGFSSKVKLWTMSPSNGHLRVRLPHVFGGPTVFVVEAVIQTQKFIYTRWRSIHWLSPVRSLPLLRNNSGVSYYALNITINCDLLASATSPHLTSLLSLPLEPPFTLPQLVSRWPPWCSTCRCRWWAATSPSLGALTRPLSQVAPFLTVSKP